MAGIFTQPPNHILLNSYEEGQGIAPHKDGPLYENKVAIISLGSADDLHFWRSNKAAGRILCILCCEQHRASSNTAASLNEVPTSRWS